MTDAMTETSQSPVNQSLGGRLPLADPATLSGAQRDLYDNLKSTWVAYAQKIGVKSVTEDGRLIGPFNAFLLHPEVTVKLNEFQAAESKHTTLAPRVREVIIIAVGAVWQAEYELYAQRSVARTTGLTDEAVATLASGGVPSDLSDDEQLAAHLAFELMRSHRVDDGLYHKAEKAFGKTGLFDILAVIGEYQVVCSMLAFFEVPAPEAATDLG